MKFHLLCWLALAMSGARAAETKIGALGHIEPAGGMVNLVGGGDVVAAVPVRPNQEVKKGDVLVEFAGRNAAETDRRMAQLALREAGENVPRAIAAHERAVALAERELELARDRLERYQKLTASSIAPQELAARQHAVFAADSHLKNAREELAQTRLANELGAERARLQLAATEERMVRSALRAPADGTVLEIRVAPGEAGSGVLMRFADLRELVVVAEVFEVDLPRVKLGARCEIAHRVFGKKLPGRVAGIGRIVNGQTKAVPVRVALDDAAEAARFLGLEVTVAIAP